MNCTPAPAIGQYVKLKNARDTWLIHRQDIHGVFHAKHAVEFSCSEMPVAASDIDAVTSLHHNIPHLLALNEQYRAAARVGAGQ